MHITPMLSLHEPVTLSRIVNHDEVAKVSGKIVGRWKPVHGPAPRYDVRLDTGELVLDVAHGDILTTAPFASLERGGNP